MPGELLPSGSGAEVVLRGTDAFAWADEAVNAKLARICARLTRLTRGVSRTRSCGCRGG
ncbi:hypothetical protein [Microbacterium sp. NPDC096154]|uniref:hypothetical protein n=1 Tax=Microbacterium sp. NPDC096154 TaxID=3155549 RepID=UPI003319F721